MVISSEPTWRSQRHDPDSTLFVPIVLLAAVSALALPAHARYGRTPVDTWARYGDHIVGRNHYGRTLGVWAPAGKTRRVIWSIKNLGGAIPKLHSVTFRGCDDANGFRFRYVTPGGKDVTWAVTHDGYVATDVNANEKSWVNVWITSTSSNRSVTCELVGDGNGDTDTVKVWAHS
jgi:hypothetical protein